MGQKRLTSCSVAIRNKTIGESLPSDSRHEFLAWRTPLDHWYWAHGSHSPEIQNKQNHATHIPKRMPKAMGKRYEKDICFTSRSWSQVLKTRSSSFFHVAPSTNNGFFKALTTSMPRLVPSTTVTSCGKIVRVPQKRLKHVSAASCDHVKSRVISCHLVTSGSNKKQLSKSAHNTHLNCPEHSSRFVEPKYLCH